MICGWMCQHGTCARAFEGRDTATGAGVPAFNFTIFEPPVTNVSADRFAAWYHTRRALVPSASTPPVHLPGSGGRMPMPPALLPRSCEHHAPSRRWSTPPRHGHAHADSDIATTMVTCKTQAASHTWSRAQAQAPLSHHHQEGG